MNHNLTKALILAAGKSTRFGSNKLVERINGKTTVQYCVEFCITNGFKDIYVTINKSDFYIKDHIYVAHPIIQDLHEYTDRINIYYEFQNEHEYGPAAAIKSWKGIIDDSFLCLFGDNFYQGYLDKSKFDFYNEDVYVSCLDYEARARNLELATIIDNVIVEKPHGVVKGKYFCGFAVFSKYVFDHIDMIRKSSRNEYEITTLINSFKKRSFFNLPSSIKWYDLTYENDKLIVEELLK